MAKRGGLGKGINSLIPESGINNSSKKQDGKNKNKDNPIKEVTKEVIKEVVKEVPIETKLKITEIEPNRNQPRKQFDEDALNELAESMKQVGMIQPIIVQKRNDYYEIVAGERRWRAAKIAGMKEVPVIIKEYSDKEVMEIALIENIQRENLNPIEEARAYKMLIEEYALLQDEVAEKVAKSRTAITNSMRLLKLCDKVQNMLIENMITSGHARALIPIEDEELQYNTAMKVFDENLSVRETEKLVKSVLKPQEVNEKEKEKDPNEMFFKEISGNLATAIGSKVTINNRKNGKGKIEIEYYSQDELERIYHMIMKEREER